jgi:hypothetical protein
MNTRFGGKGGPFRLTFQSAKGAALLGLLLTAAVPSAWGGHRPGRDQPKRCAKVHVRHNSDPCPLYAVISCDTSTGATSAVLDEVNPVTRIRVESATPAVGADSVNSCTGTTSRTGCLFAPKPSLQFFFPRAEAAVLGGEPVDVPGKGPAPRMSRKAQPADFNRNIYYKNKLEFSLESGWLPINIPFVFEFLLGDNYTRNPRVYRLVPIIASLRWQLNNIGGPSILRGNWDATFSAGATLIPSGPETRYFAFITGLRRNFIQRNWKFAPYLEIRGGLGDINAKEPYGVKFAQGQDFTFTLMLGGGVRYNFNSRYAIEGGMAYMHVSNAYLSEPKYPNYGINVYGPMFGLDIRLGKPRRRREK